MQPARHIPSSGRICGGTACGRLRSGWACAALALIALGGCGTDGQHTSRGSPLLSGSRGDIIVSAQLRPAARLAHRFANAYARNVYRRHPSHLPGVTAALGRDLAVAATRVPPARRGLFPRPTAVTLEPRGAKRLSGAVQIGDSRSPSFSVAFVVEQRGGRWRVVSISPPG